MVTFYKNYIQASHNSLSHNTHWTYIVIYYIRPNKISLYKRHIVKHKRCLSLSLNSNDSDLISTDTTDTEVF